MPAIAKQRHDTAGVPVRLAGELALSLDAFMFEIAAPEPRKLWADWVSIAETCQLSRGEQIYFDSLQHETPLRITHRVRERLRRSIARKLVRHKDLLGRYFVELTPFEAIVQRAMSERSQFKHEKGRRKVMSPTTELKLNPRQTESLLKLITPREAIEGERKALLDEIRALENLYKDWNQPPAHIEFVRAKIYRKLRDTVPDALRSFVNEWCFAELDKWRKPDAIETLYEPIPTDYGQLQRYRVISNRRSVQRRLAALAAIIRSASEDLFIHCITERDAERAVESLKNSLPAVEMEHIGEVVDRGKGELVSEALLFGPSCYVVVRFVGGKWVESRT